MTVDELIAKLQKCPPDATVLTSDGETGHVDAPDVYLMDAWKGPRFPGGRDGVETEKHLMQGHEPNCKVVVISHFGEEGELL